MTSLDADEPLEPDPYLALDVPRDATLAAIKTSYKKLVLTCHPDKVQDETAKQGAVDRFHQVQQSYEILSNDERRRLWEKREKKAKLVAEMEKLKAERRPQTQRYASSRYEPPIVEVRPTWAYEERTPKPARSAYDDDYFPPKFSEYRSMPRMFDDRFTEQLPRRGSVRMSEGRRASEVDPRLEEKLREKQMRDREAAYREESRRKRDKDKKRGTEAKFRQRAAAYVESESSGSEVADQYYSSSKSDIRSHRREEETPMKSKPKEKINGRQQSSKGPKDGVYDNDLSRKLGGIKDYIRKAESVEPEDVLPTSPRRPTRARTTSNWEKTRVSSISPPATPSARRYSGEGVRQTPPKGRDSRPTSPLRRSNRTKRTSDVADSSGSARKPPAMPSAESDPRGLKSFLGGRKSKHEPTRAATFVEPAKPRHPGLRRAETMPVNSSSRSDNRPSRFASSKKSHRPPTPTDSDTLSSSSSESSEEDSDATPMVESSRRMRPSLSRRQTSTSTRSYKMSSMDEPDEFGTRPIILEPEDLYATPARSNPPSGKNSRSSTRERSPKQSTPASSRRTSDRPPGSRGQQSSTRKTNATGNASQSTSRTSSATYVLAEETSSRRSSRPSIPTSRSDAIRPSPLKTHSSTTAAPTGTNNPQSRSRSESLNNEYSTSSPINLANLGLGGHGSSDEFVASSKHMRGTGSNNSSSTFIPYEDVKVSSKYATMSPSPRAGGGGARDVYPGSHHGGRDHRKKGNKGTTRGEVYV